MDLGSFLGRSLKDDAILEFIEMRDIQIRYEIDTLHENIPDCYWISDHEGGLCLKADQHQRLTVVFVYLAAAEGFAAFQLPLPWPIVDGVIPSLGQPAHTGSYDGNRWVRYDFPDRSIHLTSRDGVPTRLTLMAPSAVPGAVVENAAIEERITFDP